MEKAARLYPRSGWKSGRFRSGGRCAGSDGGRKMVPLQSVQSLVRDVRRTPGGGRNRPENDPGADGRGVVDRHWDGRLDKRTALLISGVDR
jgi:hypothetical protein